MSFLNRALVSLSMLAIVACGSTDSGAPRSDAGADAPADNYVAPTPDSGGQTTRARTADRSVRRITIRRRRCSRTAERC